MLHSNEFRILAITVLAISALAGCNPPQDTTPLDAKVATQECLIDKDARISWDMWDLSNDAPGGTVFRYSGCGKQLTYVAAAHGNDPDSKTFLAIRDVMADQPHIALIEGVPASRGLSPPRLIEHARSVENSPRDNEAMLTTRLAADAAIPVVGAEPDDADVIRHAQDLGISSTDVLGFYVLRQLPQMMRSEMIDGPADPRLESGIPQLVAYFAGEAGHNGDAVADIDTLAEFRLWYERLNGIPFETGFGQQDVSPSSTVPTPRPSNHVSDVIGGARDAFILDRIAAALTEHDHVLVVYGASHHTVQGPALQAAFGLPARTPNAG